MKASKNFAWIALAIAVSSCSGERTGGAIPALSADYAASGPSGESRIEVRLKIPKPGSKRGRNAKYVSSSTKSIVIKQDNQAVGAFDTTPTSKGCGLVYGSTLCRFTIGVTPGSRTFGISAFDAKAGHGNLLSKGNVTQKILVGLNIIAITMSGVVKDVDLGIGGTDGPTVGVASATSVTVMAKDADGNVIVGPGNYDTPVTVNDGDTSGDTALSVNGGSATSSVLVRSPNDRVTLNYNGKNLTSFVLTPLANGVAKLIPFIVFPSPATSYFALSKATGGTWGPYAHDITSGADGNLWFPFTYGPGANAIGKATTTGQVTYYYPGIAPSTNLPNAYFVSIAGSPAGSATAAWFDSNAQVGSIDSSGNVNVYTPPALCGSGGGGLARMTADKSGGNWVAVACSSGGDQLLHVDGHGAMTLSAQIAAFKNSYGIWLGKDAKVYVAGKDAATGKAAVLQATVSGSAVTSTAEAVSMASGSWKFVAQSADGDFWLSNWSCVSQIARLHPANSFGASMFTVIATPQGCSSPAGLVPLNDDSIWVVNWNYSTLYQIVPAANEGTPTINIVSVPNDKYNSDQLWTGTVGSDGNLYINESTSYEGSTPGDIIRVAY